MTILGRSGELVSRCIECELAEPESLASLGGSAPGVVDGILSRGANGGLAGSDVRILSRSSRKCTVTGIDSHELQGLDAVQCAALVHTNHGIVNLIMNEYACYGKGHTIHCSGQIEWFKNFVDDRSVQVGGKQRICTSDGYAMPLTCRGGLMYLSILGKPTNKDLERYPAVHLT